MRAVIQRATSGEVRVDGKVVGRLAFDSSDEAASGAVVQASSRGAGAPGDATSRTRSSCEPGSEAGASYPAAISPARAPAPDATDGHAQGAGETIEPSTLGERISGPRQGLVVLLGVQRGDGPTQVATVARKIAELRILDDERSALDAGAPILVISQFTLYGDTRKGRRPSWAHAAPGEEAEPLVDAVVADLRGRGLHVETGQFGAMMEVSLVNDGPFTVLVEA